jgi:hypothetical protein
MALARCLHLAPLCQILLASNRDENAYQIAHQLGCNLQTARNAIHAFNEKGLLNALQVGSKPVPARGRSRREEADRRGREVPGAFCYARASGGSPRGSHSGDHAGATNRKGVMPCDGSGSPSTTSTPI